MNWTDDTTMKWTYLQRRYSNELNMIFWLYLWVCSDTREQWTVFQKCSFLSNFHSSSGVSVMTHISRFWGSSRDFEERTSNHEKNQVKVPMCAKPDLPAWAGPKASQAEWAGYVLAHTAAHSTIKSFLLLSDTKISWRLCTQTTSQWTERALNHSVFRLVNSRCWKLQSGTKFLSTF